MSGDPMAHPTDEMLQELIDGRLDPAAAATVEQHLASCLRCGRLRDTLVATRRLLREVAAAEPVPAGLHDAVQRRLATAGPAASQRRMGGGWLAAAAVLLLAAVGVLYWLRSPGVSPVAEPVPDAVVTPIADPVAELVQLHATAEPSIVTADIPELERELERRVGFDPRVLDLAMMELHLAGGGTATVAGLPAAWMVYDGPAGRLLCAMLRGRLEALTAADEVRRNETFTFRVYERGGITVVAWQEGELVCFLVGGGGREAVVELAMAKAMLPV